MGMVYGRNIYQHDNPKAVVAALMAMIHRGADAAEAWEIYESGWQEVSAYCSASTPATPSSRRCCSTGKAGRWRRHSATRRGALPRAGHVERDLGELWDRRSTG